MVAHEEKFALSVQEFVDEIGQLSGVPLRSKAFAFNNQRFVDALREEGFTLDEVEQIFYAFAVQFVRTGQRPPEEGAFDLFNMAMTDFRLKPHLETLLELDDEEDLE